MFGGKSPDTAIMIAKRNGKRGIPLADTPPSVLPAKATRLHPQRTAARGDKSGQYLLAIVEIQQALRSLGEQDDIYDVVLPILLQASGFSRVYVFENHRDASGRLMCSQKAEVVAEGIAPQIDNPMLQDVAYDETLPGWDAILAEGKPIIGLVNEFPPPTQQCLAAQDISSILILPVTVRGDWFGFVGFDNCRDSELAQPAEVALLISATTTIGRSMELRLALRDAKTANARFEALARVGRDVGSNARLPLILAALAENASRTLGTDECAVWEYDEEANALIARARFGLGVATPHRAIEVSRRLNAVHTRILRAGEAVESRLSDDACDPMIRETMVERGEKTRLAIPLIFDRHPVGLLTLIEMERERHYESDEVELASAIGEQAAIALNNSHLFHRLEMQNQHLRILLDSSRSITSSIDYDEVLNLITCTAAETFDVQNCLIYECDMVRGILIARADHYRGQATPHDAVLTGKTSPLRDNPVMEYFNQHEVIEQHADDPDLNPKTKAEMDRYSNKSLLCVPLWFEDQPLGLLFIIETVKPRKFTAEEHELAWTLGEQAAAALKNARLHHVIADQAERDELTGLYNHRFFYDHLNQEIDRADSAGLPLSLLMLDIDGFKQINDRYGHLAGDQVLRDIGSGIEPHVRRGVDLVARYGGDELTVIIKAHRGGGEEHWPPSAAEHAALANTIAERIRKAVAAHRSILATGDEVALTVSIGVATYPTIGATTDRLGEGADAALYAAKHRGKNCVADASESISAGRSGRPSGMRTFLAGAQHSSSAVPPPHYQA